MERAAMTGPSKKRTPSKRAEPEPTTHRKKAEFTISVKLWMTQEIYEAIAAEAREREWSVPQVIRRCMKEYLERKSR
jgi:hypothetical protein